MHLSFDRLLSKICSVVYSFLYQQIIAYLETEYFIRQRTLLILSKNWALYFYCDNGHIVFLFGGQVNCNLYSIYICETLALFPGIVVKEYRKMAGP